MMTLRMTNGESNYDCVFQWQAANALFVTVVVLEIFPRVFAVFLMQFELTNYPGLQ